MTPGSRRPPCLGRHGHHPLLGVKDERAECWPSLQGEWGWSSQRSGWLLSAKLVTRGEGTAEAWLPAEVSTLATWTLLPGRLSHGSEDGEREAKVVVQDANLRHWGECGDIPKSSLLSLSCPTLVTFLGTNAIHRKGI